MHTYLGDCQNIKLLFRKWSEMLLLGAGAQLKRYRGI